MSQLSKRARAVLNAVVTEFITTGEPVGSRTLTRKYGFELSPATVRNVLADLEDGGYLSQPHTSAGRTPTEAAFRLYIDALMHLRRISTNDSSKIAAWFERIPKDSDLVRETGRLLCELTGAPAVIARPRIEKRPLRTLRFIPTRPGELLSVLVFADGTVENRYIHLEIALSDHELERLHHLLEELVEGETLGHVRMRLHHALAEHRNELTALKRLGLTLVEAAIDKAPRGDSDVVVEEASLLLQRPEFASSDRVRELMRALDDRERLLALLDRTLESSRVQVFLGEETEEAVGYPMTLVLAPYRDGAGAPSGAMGIIGPTRMDYPSLVPLVGATAEAMTSALAKRLEVNHGQSDSSVPPPSQDCNR